MAATQKQTLFNDPTLSDIKIKQISNGKTREYFAHKAILRAQSDYDSKTIKAATIKTDKMKRAYFAMRFQVIADKYGIQHLLMPIASDLQAILLDVQHPTDTKSFVETYYKTCLRPGTISGVRIASTLLRTHHASNKSTEFGQLCQRYPVFSADIVSSLTRFGCGYCDRTNFIGPQRADPTSTRVRCSYCDPQVSTPWSMQMI